ncbi:hypothetical protein D9757_001979 [Collybiopsis confluens]|uniref:Uncharacterized protein n=1 Tax=Collybiopsis confluens TaxID=2823264 RepID=A0A8H5HXY5_9AGAR|nr:hypothetical protein D9757_001979 [Collybiopsis confluens]
MSDKDPWAFNLRTRAYDSDSDADSDENPSSSDTIPTSDQVKLLNDFDLSTRPEDAIQYKPNPFSIAKINAASRANQSSTFYKTTKPERPGSASIHGSAQGYIPNASRNQAKQADHSIASSASRPSTFPESEPNKLASHTDRLISPVANRSSHRPKLSSKATTISSQHAIDGSKRFNVPHMPRLSAKASASPSHHKHNLKIPFSPSRLPAAPLQHTAPALAQPNSAFCCDLISPYTSTSFTSIMSAAVPPKTTREGTDISPETSIIGKDKITLPSLYPTRSGSRLPLQSTAFTPKKLQIISPNADRSSQFDKDEEWSTLESTKKRVKVSP